jgi:ABC-type uncharacterized transport system ATPase subunit
MPEVEELCNRIWFINDGKIQYDLQIKDVKKKYHHLVEFTEKLFKNLRSKKDKLKKEDK